MDRDRELQSLKNARKTLCRGSSHYPITCKTCKCKIQKGDEYYAKSGGYEWCKLCVYNLRNGIDIVS